MSDPAALFVRCSGSGKPFVTMDKNFTVVQTFDPGPGETETYACGARDGKAWLCYDVDGGTSILRKVDPDAGGDPLAEITTEVRIGNAAFSGGFCLHDIGCGELLTIERSSGQLIAIKVETVKSSLDPEDPDVELPPDPTLGNVVRRYNLILDRLDARVNGDGTRIVYVAGTSLAIYDLIEDAVVRTVHNFGVDIGYPCWLTDGSFVVNTNGASGPVSWSPAGPLVRVDNEGKLVKSYPLPDGLESDFLYGVQAMLDASACIQKLDTSSEDPANVEGVGLVWVAYSDDSDPSDHYTVFAVRLESGEILPSQQLEEFSEITDDWGVFIMLGEGGFGSGTGDANQDVGLPPKPSVRCGGEGGLSTVSPIPGCNGGGVGFTPEYTGPSGVVPEADDPEPGETLTGKTGIFPVLVHTHTVYPAETTEERRTSTVELDDEIRTEGRIRSLGDVERGMSDGQGNLQAATIDVYQMDGDGRPIGLWTVDPARKFFSGDELKVMLRSEQGRKQNLAPRMVGRGLIQAERYGTPIVSQLTAVDTIFRDGGSFSPDKKVPQWVWPRAHFTESPKDVAQKFMRVIVGEVSDNGAIDPATGLPSERGKLSGIFLGLDGLSVGPVGTGNVWGCFGASLFAIYQITGLYGSDLGGLGCYGYAAQSDGKAKSTITLDNAPDLTSIPTNGYAQIVLFTANGRTELRIIGKGVSSVKVNAKVDQDIVDGTVSWYLSRTDYVPRRVKIDLNARNGVDCQVPKWPSYVRANPYEDFTSVEGDYRVTLFWVTGPLLQAHLFGEVTLAFNAIGIEDKGDGSGLPIVDAFTAYNWWCDNMLHRQLQAPLAGQWPQTDGDLPMFADGVTKTKQSSFAAAQAQTAASLGGYGLRISAVFEDGISTRDAMQLWNDNLGCRTFIDEYGRIGVFLLDRNQDATEWPRVEHVSRVFGDVQRWRALDEAVNVVQGGCDWDPEAQKFREDDIQRISADAIAHNKGIKKYSKHIDGKLLANKDHFKWILDRKLGLEDDGPVYVSIAGCDVGVLDYPIGSGIQFTSIMGPGANGFVDHPLIILHQALRLTLPYTVDMVCLDVGVDRILIPAAQRFILTSDTSRQPHLSDDADVTPRLAA